MASNVLFTIPIPPCDAHPGGSVTCTVPRPGVYLLTWHSPPDNRLTTAFCRALQTALDVIEFGGLTPGVVITTSALPKFYSNGLDLEHVANTDGFWVLLYGLWRRFLTYPMPTLALINGHAFATGLMLAMTHDYRLAPSPKGFLCVNELLFGAALYPPMASLFRHKLPLSSYRALALEARRFAGPDAVAAGLDDALAFIDRFALVDKPKTGVYGTMKTEMHKGLIAELASPGLQIEDSRFANDRRCDDERKKLGKQWYEQWLKDNNKAKL